MYRAVGKRLLDLAGAAAGLLLLAPLLLAVAAFVRARLGSPVLYRQRRPGLGGEPFTILKFRTMRAALPGEDEAATDAQRLTPFGAFLRRASLDELPELVNVLRGEMSLVGPRPLMMEYLGRYDARQARRHEVRPGITGWAQVNGRNALSWEERFELDVWYVDHVGLALDLRILALTVLRVLRPEGVSAEGHATMPDFMGTKEKPR
jgi:sugar transferase EpsL